MYPNMNLSTGHDSGISIADKTVSICEAVRIRIVKRMNFVKNPHQHNFRF